MEMKMIKTRKDILKKLRETREWLLDGGDNTGIWLCKVATAFAERKSDEEILEILHELD